MMCIEYGKRYTALCFSMYSDQVVLGLVKQHEFGTPEFLPHYEIYLMSLSSSTQFQKTIHIYYRLLRAVQRNDFKLEFK